MYLEGMLVGFRILKDEMKSLSTNVTFKHVQIAFANARWNSSVLLRPRP